MVGADRRVKREDQKEKGSQFAAAGRRTATVGSDPIRWLGCTTKSRLCKRHSVSLAVAQWHRMAVCAIFFTFTLVAVKERARVGPN